MEKESRFRLSIVSLKIVLKRNLFPDSFGLPLPELNQYTRDPVWNNESTLYGQSTFLGLINFPFYVVRDDGPCVSNYLEIVSKKKPN